MNQIDIPDYQYYLGCNAKRMVRLTFLEKKFVRFSIGNIDLFAYSIFKNIEISLGQGVVQFEPNLEWSIPCIYESETKRIFALACLGKHLGFHTEICYYFK